MQLFLNNCCLLNNELELLRMKLLLTTGMFLLVSITSFCQEFNDKLAKVYTQTELSSMDADHLNLLEYALINGLSISDMPTEKSAKLNGEITLPQGEYTFADLGLKIENSNQYFRISGTNKVLTVKSFFVLSNELKK